MKKVVIVMLSLLAFVLVGCENGKKFNSYGFEGDYEMRTTTYWTNELGEEERSPRDMISTVKKYIENEHLYIWTNFFGMPNMDTKDLTEVEFSYDPPVEQPSNPPTGGDDGEGIENVETSKKAAIVMENGFVIVIRGDMRPKSLPIEAFEVKADKILFKNSDEFDIALTDISGNLMTIMRTHFEYGQATLHNDTIKWDIELFGDIGEISTSSTDLRDIHVRYHNTLVRK